MVPATATNKWQQFLAEVQVQVSSGSDGLADIASARNPQELVAVISKVSDIPQARIAREINNIWNEFTARLNQAA
jgi:hypothetical protein